MEEMAVSLLELQGPYRREKAKSRFLWVVFHRKRISLLFDAVSIGRGGRLFYLVIS